MSTQVSSATNDTSLDSESQSVLAVLAEPIDVIVVDDQEPPTIAYGAPALVWVPPSSDDEGESTDDEVGADDEGDEAEESHWLGHCCVSDHVKDFKAEFKSFGGGAAAVILREDLLWEPWQQIKYVFLGGTQNQQATVQRGMKEWMNYANIRFTHLPPEQISDSHIRIAFKPKDGNWSRPGMAALDYKVNKKATVNLCGINPKVEATKQQYGVVLHEIGHILGLKHEHQSPSLKGLLTWIGHEVKDYFARKCHWEPAPTQLEVLNPEDAKHLSSYTHLDLKSIMMYPMPKTTNIFGFGKKGIDIPENTCLSEYDKAFIAIHYPYFERNPHSDEWTFKRALEEVGCGESEIQRAMELFDQKAWKEIRYRFDDIYHTVRVRKNLEVESLSLFD